MKKKPKIIKLIIRILSHLITIYFGFIIFFDIVDIKSGKIQIHIIDFLMILYIIILYYTISKNRQTGKEVVAYINLILSIIFFWGTIFMPLPNFFLWGILIVLVFFIHSILLFIDIKIDKKLNRAKSNDTSN